MARETAMVPLTLLQRTKPPSPSIRSASLCLVGEWSVVSAIGPCFRIKTALESSDVSNAQRSLPKERGQGRSSADALGEAALPLRFDKLPVCLVEGFLHRLALVDDLLAEAGSGKLGGMEAAVAVKDAEVMVCKIDKARVLTGATSCALRDDVVKGRAIALLLPSGALHRARAHGFREGQIQRTYLQAQVVAPLSLPRCRTQTSAYLAGAAAAAVHFGEHVRVWKHTVIRALQHGPAYPLSVLTVSCSVPPCPCASTGHTCLCSAGPHVLSRAHALAGVPTATLTTCFHLPAQTNVTLLAPSNLQLQLQLQLQLCLQRQPQLSTFLLHPLLHVHPLLQHHQSPPFFPPHELARSTSPAAHYHQRATSARKEV
eukprot:CAMPEP_0198725164 /NCGR_PEP_ID=MMETSP1475-20131203/2521_1 /TAXON_ID= ORGANISM="Unidentified sp., Strain CCMP1999" /NCGR_SAMPLE_ID=MMETSP1475 /ASSEMBLY_ACC=CAM_ASM_001111 /LENGTH=371 /DNA_ID=CAMNT_0044486883 /DNA_START=351 /DNA_END=1463 /DNA_ORIENTATION=-